MSEGHVYRCNWEKNDDICRVWVKGRPRLAAEGDSLEYASEELVSLLCRTIGDGEAVLDFDPPVEPAAKLVSLVPNACWRPPEGTTKVDCATLYAGGICDVCCCSIGSRTKMPLPVGYLGHGDLLMSRLWCCRSLLASERFRRLLTKQEQSALEWRPVEASAGIRRTYFEVVPKAPLAYVADREQKVDGWRCPACGYSCFGVFGKYNDFIAADDLPARRPKLLTITRSIGAHLVVPTDRWRELRGKAGTKDILSSPVTVLPADRAWREPSIRALTNTGSAACNRELVYQLSGF